MHVTASGKTGMPLWRAWLPALVWLGLIVFESTSTLSAENTSRILYPLLHYLFGVDPVHFQTWHFLLRKTGHVLGYGILSLLLFRAWRATIGVSGNARWSVIWTSIAIVMTALVAGLDEWHQSFLPSRTGRARDVVLDTAAAVAAQILLYLYVRGSRGGVSSAPNSCAARK